MTLGEKLYSFFEELEKSGLAEAFNDLIALKVIDCLVDDMFRNYKDEILSKEVNHEGD